MNDAIVHPIYGRLLALLLEEAASVAAPTQAAVLRGLAQRLAGRTVLARSTTIEIMSAALAATGRPWLGLELGLQFPVSVNGSLGFAAMSAATLGDALATLQRFGATRVAYDWGLRGGAEGLILELRPTIEWGPAAHFATDAVLGCLVVILQSAVGRLPANTQLDLPRPRPAWSERYARLGFAEVRFDQPVMALHFPTAVLATPCLGADARAHSAARRECELALAEQNRSALTHRIGGMLASVSHGRFPTLAECAAQLHLTPRTLIRRLAAEGSAYQTLLDNERRARARWLIESTSSSMEDIAAELGFASASNFGRTVRRWFGRTPTALRRNAATAAVPPAPTVD